MFSNSALVTAQALLTQSFEASELRYREPVTFRKFLTNSELFFPSYTELRTREDRAIEAYYINRSSRALGAGRSHNHVGTVGSSGKFIPAWNTANDKFAISLKQGDNNVYDHQAMLNAEFKNVIANFTEANEAAAIAFLFAQRSGVNGVTSEGTFNAVNDAFEITEATNGDRLIQIVKSVMDVLKYRGTLTIFCDTVFFNKAEKMAAQGAGNAVNLQFQFSNVMFVHSVDLTAAAATLGYTKGFAIAAPDGTYGVLPWIPIQNRQGIITKENMYSTIINPVDGLSYAMHNYETRADATATGGYTQDVVTQAEVSIDLAFENAPLSNAGETTFQAFALV